MKKILVLALAVFWSGGQLRAAENNSVVLRTLAPESAEADATALAVIGADGKLVPLDAPRYNISLPCSVPKLSPLQVFDRIQLTDFMAGKTKDMPQPLFEVSLAEKDKSLILVLGRGPKGEWIPHAVPDGDKAFPGGSRLFINLTPFALKGNIESAAFDVPKNAFKLVDSPVPGEETVRRNVQVFADVNGSMKAVSSTRWTFSAQRRGVVVVFRDPQAGDFRLFALPDNLFGTP